MSGRGLTACNHGEASLTSGPGYGFSGAMCHKCGAFARFEAAAAREALAGLDAFKVHVDTLRAAIRSVRPSTGYKDEAIVIAAAEVLADLLEARAARASDGGR